MACIITKVLKVKVVTQMRWFDNIIITVHRAITKLKLEIIIVVLKNIQHHKDSIYIINIKDLLMIDQAPILNVS